jgi:phosphoribosylpyrophosphate synthetase
LTGGTLRETRDKLYQAGADKVSAFVTHAVFPQESWKRFTTEENGFNIFYVTDSIPEVTNIIKDKKPFNVIPLAKSIVGTILKY